ncbi:Protein kinase-like domain [Pseudocohnilembus persalinus]|uniref:non-specific serine/threonine protein kinase n=1 Tax=Pseudocohnilembus persalinus TaxID=266149 RepID=A0A0V0QPG8_PSEPJ|nr:Protein kinase-like domain [Pseudocohnilembus persalinus]|eukprot:KRX04155.1 Protein kinase-like domain [Pseudocohnilembus persalinus]
MDVKNLIQIIENQNQDNSDPKNELKLIDQFIQQNAKNYEFSEIEHVDLLKSALEKRIYTQQWAVSVDLIIPLKHLQLVRLLTRDKNLLDFISDDEVMIEVLNQILTKSYQNLQGIVSKDDINLSLEIAIEVLSILKRLITFPQMFEFIQDQKLFTTIIDLITITNPQLLKSLLNFLQIFFEYAPTNYTSIYYNLDPDAAEDQNRPKNYNLKLDFIQEFGQLFYVSKIIFICEKYEESFKIQSINLLTKIVNYQIICDNFRRIRGLSTLINILKKIQQQNIENTKSGHVNLQLLNDLSVAILNFMAKFVSRQEVIYDFKQEAVFELELHCFRLLRFLFSIEKNRKVFKMLFPAKIFGLFIDIGNFAKKLEKYINLTKQYNQLDKDDLLSIVEGVKQIGSTMLTSTINNLSYLGSYQLIEVIGKGAFGTVFLAKKGENKYALKLLQQNKNTQSEEDLKQSQNISEYYKEVAIYKTLKHPNIVKYYESFLHEGQLCIVMELVEGFNLSELIKIQTEKGVPFKENQIWKIIIDLCSVLKYLHDDQQILHRDLNPANIMIDSSFNIKLADFGLAKRINQTFQLQQSFVGTLAYSSPEIVQNKQYSQKADIWSLGCILYELVKLKPAFSGTNPLTMAKNIVNEEYDDFQQNNKLYSKELLAFVKDCLIPQEQNRPDVLQMMSKITPQIIEQMNQLKEKEYSLNEEVLNLTKRINQKPQENFIKKPLIKIESENLNKIEEDPVTKFMQIIQKISFIAHGQTSHKNNFKKFLVDLFYNKVILNLDFHGNQLKEEIQKLLNLSKNEISPLNIKFDQKQFSSPNNSSEKKNQNQIITYEMMYFYIDELFQIIKKEQQQQ